VDAGADIKHEMEIEGRFNFFHFTPYQVAVFFGNTNCLRAMLPRLSARDLRDEISTSTSVEGGAGLEPGSAKGGSLLAHAADAGFFDIYRLLLDHGAKVDPLSFLYAVQRNHLEMVKYILRTLRVDVNYKMTDTRKVDLSQIAYQKADSALHGAAERGYECMVDLLIRHGAHVNAVTPKDNMRPLDVALEVFNGACRKYSDYRARPVNCSGISAVINLLQKYGGNPGLGANRQYLLPTSYSTQLAEREAMILESFGPAGMPKPFTPNVTDDDMLQTSEPQLDWDLIDETIRRDREDREKMAESHYAKLKAEREASIRKWNDMSETERDRIRKETLDAIAPGSQSIENQIKRAIETNPDSEVARKLVVRQEAMRKADELAALNSRNLMRQIEEDEKLRDRAFLLLKSGKAKQEL